MIIESDIMLPIDIIIIPFIAVVLRPDLPAGWIEV